MISTRFGDRPLCVISDGLGGRDDASRIYLPPRNKEDKYGEHAGDIEKEHDGSGWVVRSLALHDYDQSSISRLKFKGKKACGEFVAETYKQIKAARDASPVPEDIRIFIEAVGRDLADEDRALRGALLNHVSKCRWITDLAKKHGIGSLYLRVEDDAAKMVQRIMNWKREGDDIPFFSEAILYELIGKEDARSLLALINDMTMEIDPIEAVDPRREEVAEA
tara:strand:- start:4452 stop:5114 length:663 start_codon:yes stop_codon:yes gene_type:complete